MQTTSAEQLAYALRTALDYINTHAKAPRDTRGKHARIMAVGFAQNALARHDASQLQPAAEEPEQAAPVTNGDHSTGLWRALNSSASGGGVYSHHITAGDRNINIQTLGDEEDTWREAAANARRVVACVNACADATTEHLESGNYGIVQTRFEYPPAKRRPADSACHNHAS